MPTNGFSMKPVQPSFLRSNVAGTVVTYKVSGRVEQGKLHLKPAPAVYSDSDELLQEAFLVTMEPKGWGRHVASVVWSCSAGSALGGCPWEQVAFAEWPQDAS